MMTIAIEETMDLTMKIDGIDGGLELEHAQKEFLVRSLIYSVRGPQHTPGTVNNGVTGGPSLTEFGVLINRTQADAVLLGKTLKGETIPKIVITRWTTNDGKTVRAQQYTVLNSSIALLTEGSVSNGPTRRMLLNVVEIKEESFKPDGSSSGSTSYNFKTGRLT
jgi:hypothetical protein